MKILRAKAFEDPLIFSVFGTVINVILSTTVIITSAYIIYQYQIPWDEKVILVTWVFVIVVFFHIGLFLSFFVALFQETKKVKK